LTLYVYLNPSRFILRYRYAEVKWYNPAKAFSKTEIVTIFDKNENEITSITLNCSSGIFITSIIFNLNDIRQHEGVFFYARVFQYGYLIKSATLRTHISWMSEIDTVIGNTNFRELIIPGSHDCCAFAGPMQYYASQYFQT